MNEPNIVILAGGISSRMKKMPINLQGIDPALLADAQQKSKAMIGVGDGSRPFLDFLLYNIESAGYSNAVIVVGERDNSIKEYYETKGNASLFPNLQLRYAVQHIPPGRSKPPGTADALQTALQSNPEWRGQSLTVCNSDNLYSTRSLSLLLEDCHPNAMIDYDRASLRFSQERIEQFAVIKKDPDGFLEEIIEKPTPEQVASVQDKNGRTGVSMNIFRLSYDMIVPILETIPLHPVRNEKELPVAVKMLVECSPRSVFTIPLSEHVPDLTSPEDIPEMKKYLLKKENLV